MTATHDHVLIDPARAEDFPAAQSFYDFCAYGGPAIEATDSVMLAWHQGEIVGIARLCKEATYLCLRGMQVHPGFQRMGLGTRILERLEREIGAAPCYCLPYSHLLGFYAQAGFRLVEAPLPGVLATRLAENRKRGLDVIAMYRPVGLNAAVTEHA